MWLGMKGNQEKARGQSHLSNKTPGDGHAWKRTRQTFKRRQQRIDHQQPTMHSTNPAKKDYHEGKLKAEHKWTASSRLCTVDSETPMQQQTSSFSLRQRKQDPSFNSKRGKEKGGQPWPMEKPTLKPTENQSTNDQDRITVKKKDDQRGMPTHQGSAK